MNGQNPYLHLKGVLPNESARFDTKIFLANEDNSSIITVEQFELVPEEKVSSYVTTSYQDATVHIDVENPLYVEGVEVSIFDENNDTVRVDTVILNDEGKMDYFYSGSVGKYSSVVNIDYRNGGTVNTKSDFTLTARPSTGGGSTGGGNSGGGNTGPTGPDGQ